MLLLNIFEGGQHGQPFSVDTPWPSSTHGAAPDHVPIGRWQQAVEDGRWFLARWGKQAEALGWTARDLFGLHQPPPLSHPRRPA